MKKFRSISIILAFAMIITLLAGCGGTSSDTAKKESSDSTSSPEAINSKEKVTLNLWHTYGESATDTAYLEVMRMVDEFNKKYEGQIEVVPLANQQADKQLAAITAGEGPDVAQAQWTLAPTWGGQGAMEPLDAYIAADSTFDTQDFVKGAWSQGQYRGKQYIIPYFQMTMLLFYNKDLLKEAGFDHGPTTIEEFVDMAVKTTKFDEKGNITQLGFKPDYPWRDDVAWPVAFGANWLDEKGNATFDSPEMIETYQWMADYCKKIGLDKMNKFAAGFGNGPNHPFITGKLAMELNGEWDFDVIKQHNPNLNYGVTFAPPPASRKDKLSGTGMIGMNGWYMSSQSKYKDEAWKLISFISSKEQYAKSAQIDMPQMKPRISALQAFQTNAKATDMQKTVAGMYAADKMRGFPTVPYVNQYLGEIYTDITAACEGKMTVEEACKKVQAFIKPYAETEAIGNQLKK